MFSFSIPQIELPRLRHRTAQLLSWLFGAWRGNWAQTALNALVGVAGVAVSLGQVMVMKHTVDAATVGDTRGLWTGIALMVACVAADFGLSISSVWIRNILGVRARCRMQARVFDVVVAAQWQGRRTRHSADVVNRLESDVATITNFVTETVPQLLSTIALFVGAFCMLFVMDRVLAVVVVAVLPLFLLISRVYVRRMRRLTRAVREAESGVQSVMQETVQHHIIVKALQCADAVRGKLDDAHRTLRGRVKRRTKFSVFSNLMVNTGFVAGYFIAFGRAAVRLSQHTLTFGGMTAFLQLVNRIQGPARELAAVIPQVVSVITAAERLMELEEMPTERNGSATPMAGPCGLRLDSATFTYEGDPAPVLQDLSCDFRPGTRTAVVGETGAGKTTLVRIMLGLVSPQQGSATIYNRQNAEPLTPQTRCNIVYVPQGNTLMSGTIRSNLRLGRPDASDGDLREALHQACADFVFDLPDGLATRCAETGTGLSEGQAQRIAIARALLRRGPVLLLDEATSALDKDTERQVLENIFQDRQRTIICVTHGTAVAELCDETIEIKRTKR